ncbi:hypothetical protein FOL47_005846 [Perkinsus chesapeaki]|uniref:Uncharacterized protein n=1 Tax=Perkinsus chesapeaki TaxID=330153 RepID=A0A7J6LWQ9_PERCH|nr:hypothetical protein FOL47_005846 [Perkinsus chesapeaki]
MTLAPIPDGGFDVTAKISSMPNAYYPDAMTIDGVYVGNGRGTLYVASNGHELTKYMSGTRTKAAYHMFTLESGCPNKGTLTNFAKLQSSHSDILLMACNKPFKPVFAPQTTLSPTTHPLTIFAWAYSLRRGISEKFYIKLPDGLAPAGMAELPSGDIIIALRGNNKNDIQIGYIAAESLHQAIKNGANVKPEVILNVNENNEFDIGYPISLTVRQDPETEEIFVYMLSGDDQYKPRRTFLTVYQWSPKIVEPVMSNHVPCVLCMASECSYSNRLLIGKDHVEDDGDVLE